MYTRRAIHQISNWIGKNKVLILYGARQVGKSTLLKLLSANTDKDILILSAENPTVAEVLMSKDLSRIKFLFGSSKIVAIDEAQKISDIGSILKYIHDSEEISQQIIATGSSSFELSNKITEPLTGRNIKFNIFPFSVSEIIDAKGSTWTIEHLEDLLIYGQYPATLDEGIEGKRAILDNLSIDYLFQDVLSLDNLLNANTIKKILKALALQLGSEVSYHEIAQLLGIAPQTVERYLDLLEKSFVITSLPSLSRNLRNELKKSKKYFFVDLGLRNAILSNYAPLANRTDVGALWENFCVMERIKSLSLQSQKPNLYFWRTYDQAEIDLIEESNGKYDIWEFKWNPKKKVRWPKSFMAAYEVGDQNVISRANFYELGR